MPVELRAETITDVLAKGNSKLGGHTYSFSLPALSTCPGKSGLCSRACYAMRRQSHFVQPSVRRRYAKNLRLSRAAGFAATVIRLLRRSRWERPRVRLHVSGDFYSAAYVRKWRRVARACPGVTFWAYTRSWRVPAVRAALEELASLPNVHLWYSWDDETGPPEGHGPRVRLAYMQTEAGNTPAGDADVVFRDHALRGSVAKHVGGSLVCPPENGASGGVRCSECKICFTDPAEDPARRTRGRFPLNVLEGR